MEHFNSYPLVKRFSNASFHLVMNLLKYGNKRGWKNHKNILGLCGTMAENDKKITLCLLNAAVG